MSKVITFSRTFPSYHPKAGQPTYFVEKLIEWYFDTIPHNFHNIPSMIYQLNPSISKEILDAFLNDLKTEIREWKEHTVRGGKRFKPGDMFSPRVWGNDINPKSGRSGPYHSKQIVFLPDIKVKKTWDIEFRIDPFLPQEESVLLLNVDGHYMTPEIYIPMMANNDGLTLDEFVNWFTPKPEMVNFSGQIICWNENINY